MKRRDIDQANPLEIGQRINLWRWVGMKADRSMDTVSIEGVIVRLVECDTGILMRIRTDDGIEHGSHLQRRFVAAGLVDGVMLRTVDYSIDIVHTPPRQFVIPMLARMEIDL